MPSLPGQATPSAVGRFPRHVGSSTHDERAPVSTRTSIFPSRKPWPADSKREFWGSPCGRGSERRSLRCPSTTCSWKTFFSSVTRTGSARGGAAPTRRPRRRGSSAAGCSTQCSRKTSVSHGHGPTSSRERRATACACACDLPVHRRSPACHGSLSTTAEATVTSASLSAARLFATSTCRSRRAHSR